MNQTLVCNSCLFVRQSFADRLDSRASVIENPGKLPIYDFIHPTQTINHLILDLKGRLIAGDVATVQRVGDVGTNHLCCSSMPGLAVPVIVRLYQAFSAEP